MQNRCQRWLDSKLAAAAGMPAPVCEHCGSLLPQAPYPGGIKKKYCTHQCKRSARNKREREKFSTIEKRAVRAVSYLNVKANPDRYAVHLKQGRRYMNKTREWLADYKLEHGCVDCGYRQHAAALQLDHEGPKAIPIADARSSVARLKAEIEAGSCKVRCANCHSIRTWERKRSTMNASAAETAR